MIALLILSLAASTHALGEYSDEFARKFMFPLSAAAYSDQPQLCVKNLFPNSTVIAFLDNSVEQKIHCSPTNAWL